MISDLRSQVRRGIGAGYEPLPSDTRPPPPTGGTSVMSPERGPFTPAQEARIRQIVREEIARNLPPRRGSTTVRGR